MEPAIPICHANGLSISGCLVSVDQAAELSNNSLAVVLLFRRMNPKVIRVIIVIRDAQMAVLMSEPTLL